MPSSTIGPPDGQGRFPADCQAAASEAPDWEKCAAVPRPHRTGLLVSVRSAAEAQVAAAWGADVVDVKEPARGALGAADAAVWQAIDAALPSHVSLSAALGEAVSIDALEFDQLPGRFRFAKAGPAGLNSAARLKAHWQTLARRLPAGTELVAVAYADHRAADCPPPETVLRAAADAGIGRWLLDTLVKDGRSVVELLGAPRLEAIDRLAGRWGVPWVLAGSLRRAAYDQVAELRPWLVGVRGDVCRGGRSGTIDGPAIAQWRHRLATGGNGRSQRPQQLE